MLSGQRAGRRACRAKTNLAPALPRRADCPYHPVQARFPYAMSESAPSSPCPECGQPQTVTEQGLSLIARCGGCGWMVATTNPNHPIMDRTPYTLRVRAGDLPTASAVARLAVALGIGVKRARDLIAQDLPVAENVLALEAIRLYGVLAGAGLQVGITPPLRWPLERRD